MVRSVTRLLLASTLLAGVPLTAALAQDNPASPAAGDPDQAQGAPTPAAGQVDQGAATQAAGNGADAIIVTGIRNSLASAAKIKRDANQIVDSITATDVGKFPDTNIAESLQRITGVAIDRSGGEGQFITVRGLGPEFNTVLVNGRVMATDNPGREFSFDVLSSNMIQRTDVYKSPVPELQEGGIGATVNIITARPLDGQSGFHVAASAGGIYDRLRKKASPDMSAVTSWTNQDKTIGLVLSGSYTDRKSQLDFVQTEGWIYGPERVINGTPSSTGLTPASITTTGTINVPQNLQVVREMDRRKRINFAGAFQAKPTDRLLVTVDGVYSKFNVYSNLNRFANFYSAPYIGLDVDGTGSATGFNRPGTEFLANNPGLAGVASLSQNDNIVSYSNRLTQSYQIGANIKWNPIDDLEIRFDASRTKATQRNPNAFVVVGSLAQSSPRFDLTPGQDLPVASNFGDITDPSLMRAHFTQQAVGRVRDIGKEYHIDTVYTVHDSILTGIHAGLEYSERHKVQRNFANDDGNCAYCGYEVPIPSNLLTPYALNNFLSDASGSSQLPKNFFAYDPNAIIAYLSDPATLAIPRQGRTVAQQQAEAARLLALPGGPFGTRENLGSRLDVLERVASGYFSAQFGGERWSGNAGVRVVNTSTLSRGFDLPVVNVTTTTGDDTLQYTYGTATPIAVRNSYTNVLPSANVKYNLTRTVIARAAFSVMVTRPTLTDLGVNNSYGGRVAVPLSNGGNPNLKPFKSKNYDISLEWYPSRVNYVSAGAFYKDLSSFLELQTLPVERFGRIYQDTRTRNGQSGYIRGVEVGGQFAFDFLKGWLGGFGVQGNYTYVDSKAKREIGLADYQCGYNGLSPHSANGSVFYEKFGIEARASYNWRSDYLRACRSDQSRPRNRSAYGQFDFNLAYNINSHFQVYVQGVNVLNEHVKEWSAIEERFLLFQDSGSRYNFGARVKF
ncbi:TonB-dependent receptor [Sphingomonas morindae]|uniref:TonB-dependent receptor n=1 Tax=Sphingomonas morindae TaxID=1541170 RepID=A0ABY4X4T8_9SPHN|nr:TonB-dependent receptor [Sphingomonas morindae]USI71918.1 TonB-dependent receptor [Sphingomonas morindae]